MSEDALQILNWDAVPLEQVNPSMKRRVITSPHMTVARIWLEDGFLVPMHSHKQEQITQVVSGTMRFTFGERRDRCVDVGPGGTVVIPAWLPHEALVIGDVEEMDMWTPRRDDWLDGSDQYLRG